MKDRPDQTYDPFEGMTPAELAFLRDSVKLYGLRTGNPLAQTILAKLPEVSARDVRALQGELVARAEELTDPGREAAVAAFVELATAEADQAEEHQHEPTAGILKRTTALLQLTGAASLTALVATKVAEGVSPEHAEAVIGSLVYPEGFVPEPPSEDPPPPPA